MTFRKLIWKCVRLCHMLQVHEISSVLKENYQCCYFNLRNTTDEIHFSFYEKIKMHFSLLAACMNRLYPFVSLYFIWWIVLLLISCVTKYTSWWELVLCLDCFFPKTIRGRMGRNVCVKNTVEGSHSMLNWARCGSNELYERTIFPL